MKIIMRIFFGVSIWGLCGLSAAGCGPAERPLTLEQREYLAEVQADQAANNVLRYVQEHTKFVYWRGIGCFAMYSYAPNAIDSRGSVDKVDCDYVYEQLSSGHQRRFLADQTAGLIRPPVCAPQFAAPAEIEPPPTPRQ